MVDPIRVEGLAAFARALRKLDADAAKGLRLAQNEAAAVIVDAARPRFPRRSGRAAGTLKAKSTRTAVRVAEGGNRAPYVPWLDFGGRVGRRRSVVRPFLKEGRFLYAAYYDHRDDVAAAMETALTRVVRDAGLDAD